MFGIISKSSIDGAIAGMAQSVEHVIGNDEVTSSNLVTSSMKMPRESLWNKGSRGFLVFKKFDLEISRIFEDLR